VPDLVNADCGEQVLDKTLGGFGIARFGGGIGREDLESEVFRVLQPVCTSLKDSDFVIRPSVNRVGDSTKRTSVARPYHLCLSA
jgi:hypothetical protein